MSDTAPFDVVPFSGGEWKVLDWQRGRYIRTYASMAGARRYAGARNRKAGFYGAPIRNRPLCSCCGSRPCVRARSRA